MISLIFKGRNVTYVESIKDKMITQNPIVNFQHLLRIRNALHFLWDINRKNLQFRFLNCAEKTKALNYYLLLEIQFRMHFMF